MWTRSRRYPYKLTQQIQGSRVRLDFSTVPKKKPMVASVRPAVLWGVRGGGIISATLEVCMCAGVSVYENVHPSHSV